MELGGTLIYVDDVPAVLDFYQRAFGIEAKFVDLDVQLPRKDPSAAYQFAELDTEGGSLQIASHSLGVLLLPGYQRPADGRPTGVEIAFISKDVDHAYERAVAAGAVVLAAPKLMPWGRTIAYVRSIEGTLVALCSPEGGEL